METCHIGAVLLKQGTLQQQRALLAALSSLPHEAPLLTLGDFEYGAAMRLENAIRLPKNRTLGAISHDHLLAAFGREVGRECRVAGIGINLAPVVDVNTNPNNPVIGVRAFGSDPDVVARKGGVIVRAMESQGIGACLKHFPGHGDTLVDSHHDLPHAGRVELLPFRRIVDEGVSAVMTAHIVVDGSIVTFSPKIVEDILRNEYNFQGLIISDALNMAALTRYFTAEEIAVKTVLAGHDLLLYGDHKSDEVNALIRTTIPRAHKAILAAIRSGDISEAALDTHVERILQAKEKFCHPQPLDEPLDTLEARTLQRRLYQCAVSVIGDRSLLPRDKTVPLLIVSKVTDAVLETLRELREKNSPYIVVLYTSPDRFPELGRDPLTIVVYEDLPLTREMVDEVLLTGEIRALRGPDDLEAEELLSPSIHLQ
jgi:beta-glucosidase-like glycosyl hydrolase